MRITPADQHRRATGLHHQQHIAQTRTAQRYREVEGANRRNRLDVPAAIAQQLQVARPGPVRNMQAIEYIAERAGQPDTAASRFLISALLLSQHLPDRPALTRETHQNAVGEGQSGIDTTAPEALPGLLADTGLFDRYRRSASAVVSAPAMPVSDTAVTAAEHRTLKYVVTEPLVQEAVLNRLMSLLQRSGMLPADRVAAFEREYARMGRDLVMTVSYVRADEVLPVPHRGRRIAINATPSPLLVNRDRAVRGRLLNANPCRIGITTAQGGKGDTYIVAGNYLEDPFRDVLENTGQPPTFWQQFGDAALNGLVTVVTLGIKDAVTFPIAHGIRAYGHLLNNQGVCAHDEWAPAQLAVWATTLTLEHGEVSAPHFTPVTERVVLAAAARAEPGVVRSTPAYLKSVRDPLTGNHLQARKLANGHYVVIDPAAATPVLKVRPLLANEAGDIHLAGSPQGHSIESRFGFESHTVVVDDHILSTKKSGLVTQFLERESSGHPLRTPVELYQDKLSGNTHRATENGNPVFSTEEKLYTSRMSASMENWFTEPNLRFVAVSEPNRCTASDSQGPVYRVYSAGEDGTGTLPLNYHVVDLGGKIVPVELVARATRSGVEISAERYYTSVDYGNELFGQRPLEFDGHRWTYVKATRPAIAPEINPTSHQGLAIKMIMQDPSIQQSALKANSVDGLWRHIESGRTYIKTGGKFVRIERSEGGFVATDPAGEIRIPLALREKARTPHDNASAAVEPEKEYSLSWKGTVSPAGVPNTNSQELMAFSGASHKMYAVDVRNPEQVQRLGFSDSQAMVAPNMLGDEPAVEVYESLEAVRRRVVHLRLGGSQDLHVYEVNAQNLPGVSLNQNALVGSADIFLQQHPGSWPAMEVMPNDRFGSNSWRRMVVNSGGRIFFEPAHLRARDLSPSQMARYPNRVKQVPESYLQTLPRLEEGLWTRALPDLIM